MNETIDLRYVVPIAVIGAASMFVLQQNIHIDDDTAKLLAQFLPKLFTVLLSGAFGATLGSALGRRLRPKKP